VSTLIGEATVKLVTAPGSSLIQASPGGSTITTALPAARPGYPTALMARLSNESLDQFRRMRAADGTDSPYFLDTASCQGSAAELGKIPANTTAPNLDLLDWCVLPEVTWTPQAAARQRNRTAVLPARASFKYAGDVVDAVEAGDEKVNEFMQDLGRLAGIPLAAALTVPDPDVVVVESRLGSTSTALMKDLSISVTSRCTPSGTHEPAETRTAAVSRVLAGQQQKPVIRHADA
jgi:hypothetical protein